MDHHGLIRGQLSFFYIDPYRIGNFIVTAVRFCYLMARRYEIL
jgi:hypothetical protein